MHQIFSSILYGGFYLTNRELNPTQIFMVYTEDPQIHTSFYIYLLNNNFCLLCSFSFLYGPWAHLKTLFSKERALTTSLYAITLTATLYCALHLMNTPLTVICAAAQVIVLFWMMTASIPGGSSGMRFFGNMFKSSVSNTLPI